MIIILTETLAMHEKVNKILEIERLLRTNEGISKIYCILIIESKVMNESNEVTQPVEISECKLTKDDKGISNNNDVSLDKL